MNNSFINYQNQYRPHYPLHLSSTYFNPYQAYYPLYINAKRSREETERTGLISDLTSALKKVLARQGSELLKYIETFHLTPTNFIDSIAIPAALLVPPSAEIESMLAELRTSIEKAQTSVLDATPLSTPHMSKSLVGNHVLEHLYKLAQSHDYKFAVPPALGLAEIHDLKYPKPGIKTIGGKFEDVPPDLYLFSGDLDPSGLYFFFQGIRDNCALLAVLGSTLCRNYFSNILNNMYDDQRGNVYVKIFQPQALPEDPDLRGGYERGVKYHGINNFVIIKLPKKRAMSFEFENYPKTLLWLNLFEQAYEQFTNPVFQDSPDHAKTYSSQESLCKTAITMYNIFPNIHVLEIDYTYLADKYNTKFTLVLDQINAFVRAIFQETYLVPAGMDTGSVKFVIPTATFDVPKIVQQQSYPEPIRSLTTGHAHSICRATPNGLELFNPWGYFSKGEDYNPMLPSKKIVPWPSKDLMYYPILTFAIKRDCPQYRDIKDEYERIATGKLVPDVGPSPEQAGPLSGPSPLWSSFVPPPAP